MVDAALEIRALVIARREHEEAFRASQEAHERSNKALLAARAAGASWEEIAEAAGRRSSLGPEVAAHAMKTFAIALWRSGRYGEVPDEALFAYERKEREKSGGPTPQPTPHGKPSQAFLTNPPNSDPKARTGGEIRIEAAT